MLLWRYAAKVRTDLVYLVTEQLAALVQPEDKTQNFGLSVLEKSNFLSFSLSASKQTFNPFICWRKYKLLPFYKPRGQYCFVLFIIDWWCISFITSFIDHHEGTASGLWHHLLSCYQAKTLRCIYVQLYTIKSEKVNNLTTKVSDWPKWPFLQLVGCQIRGGGGAPLSHEVGWTKFSPRFKKH